MKIEPIVEIMVSPLKKAETTLLIQAAILAMESNFPITRGNGNPYSLTIRLDTSAAVQKLNSQFRQQNKPTNVLSFPTSDPDAEEEKTFYLGDIIIASEVLETEAKAENKKLEHHLQHLVIHGTLHLFGYDHVLEHEAEIMESLEIKLLKKLKIKNPYE